MTLKRMDNMGIVVESLDVAISFFTELGLKLEGRATIEGEWAGRLTGLGHQRVEIAMLITPNGHSRLELSRFLDPPIVADHRNAPVNALGYLRVMFTVDDIDETLVRLRRHGAQLVGDVVQYENAYRLCYIHGPEGLLIGLAEELRSRELPSSTARETDGAAPLDKSRYHDYPQDSTNIRRILASALADTPMQIRHTSSVYHTDHRALRSARLARPIVTRAACYQTRVSAMRGNPACVTERRAICTALARDTHHHGVHVATGLASHASTTRPGHRRPSD
jgi:catechol 2,3-dioxygenase-like lactoylglutathione lyase family enzyme